ncbi:hypothetical protein H072_10127 [Dactylellina haptotyla CBS 200.50]|uniref:Uncharacterized protein n=1 Tax=Dactylellina haptotyla (strain CBS 200.50) TaxID=1284197 RepID=S8BB57_DACHA|nr:hypothetical protein H072_10127 [Dactylellina haptotyla CBS 200.50]
MNKIATPLLYEMVNIITNDEYQWEDRQVECLTRIPNRNLNLIKQLLNFCVRPANTTECMGLIERMEEDQLQCIELFQKGDHGDGCKEVVEAMFRKNKRFRAIYIDMGEKNLYDKFFPLISASSDWLATLILVIEKKDSFLYNLDAVLTFLQSLKYLRSFELDMVEYFEDSPWYTDDGVRLIDSIFALPTVEQLVFGGSDFPYDLFHERYPDKRIGKNLSQFGFFSGVACDNFLLKNFDTSKLRALRILWPVETDFTVLGQFMVSFKGLRSLHLTLRNPDCFDSLRCISHHGETLERLSLRVFTPNFKPFGRFGHSAEDFEDMLKSCTALRELAVPVTYVHDYWGQPFNAEANGVKDILWNELDWRFQWPDTVSSIESLHILNEPLPADNSLRLEYHKNRRREVITCFARAFHDQVNIRGIADDITHHHHNSTSSTTSLNNNIMTLMGGRADDPTATGSSGTSTTTGMDASTSTATSTTTTPVGNLGKRRPPLLPNLKAILFGDNTKCGRDSCLYLHDWEFEEMDLVPVVIDRFEFEGDEVTEQVEKEQEIEKEKEKQEARGIIPMWEKAGNRGTGTGNGLDGGGGNGSAAIADKTKYDGKSRWEDVDKLGRGVKWRFKEVDWAEFVGRFPWLHDFEIDARGWMDERTRIENRDKFRFWE